MNIFKIIEKKCCQRGRESVQNNLNTKSVRYYIVDIISSISLPELGLLKKDLLTITRFSSIFIICIKHIKIFFSAPAELIRRFVLWNMFRFDEFLEQTCSFILAFSIAKFPNALSGKKFNPKKTSLTLFLF